MSSGGEPNTAAADRRVARLKYGYDWYSNRTYRKDEIYTDASQAYAYDDLHRLTQSKQVQLDANNAPLGGWPVVVQKD